MFPRVKRLLPVILLAFLAVGGARTIYPNNSQEIGLRPLRLDPARPGPRRVGELIFLNAWELGSNNEDFGGISALAALADGRFVGVSDAGTLIGFGLTSDDRTDRPFIAPLPGSQGPDATYKDRDSEGIAYNPDSGQFWVSYEANHAIRRFSRSFARSSGTVRPHEMQNWPRNKGAESIVRLTDGRFIVIAESLEGDDTHQALLFSGDPVEPGTDIARFTYRPPPGYRVTDGVQLPDGRLLILNRRVWLPTGFSAKLAVVDISAIGKDAMVAGKVIATIASPLLIDNMEGIAVTESGAGTIIWLISDNNFNIFQRTLLMKFRLSERSPKKKPEAATAPGFESL
jgi:hypothetical protein